PPRRPAPSGASAQRQRPDPHRRHGQPARSGPAGRGGTDRRPECRLGYRRSRRPPRRGTSRVGRTRVRWRGLALRPVLRARHLPCDSAASSANPHRRGRRAHRRTARLPHGDLSRDRGAGPLSAPRESSFYASDGTTLRYFRWDGSGIPVVLLHGFMSDTAHHWRATGVADPWAKVGRHVLAMDASGHGLSDKPTDPAAYGEDRMATDVIELVDHLDVDTFDLVCYSMGAAVALLVTARD